LEVLTVDTWY